MTNNSISIPFNRPYLVGKEYEYISQAMIHGHISGDGQFSKKCHTLLEASLGVTKALLTTSCTHALEMMAILLNFQPGDELILPAFTFVTSANAFVLRGGIPVFADIRPDTLNIDETKIEALITPRTRAILVVHYAGVACEMDTILEIARKHNIPVLEDNAHGLFAYYKGRLLGTFGTLAAQSFHETKNFTSGEGGALLINDPSYIERAEIIREKGTDRSRFFRGQVDKYGWVDIGSSYLPSDVLAAFLYAQLEARELIQGKRRQLWEIYRMALEDWASRHDIRLPYIPPGCEQAYHMFYLILPSLETRQALIAHLRQKGILAVFHYLPLNQSEMVRRAQWPIQQCPVTESISDRLLRLPFYTGMTEDEQTRVIEALGEFKG